MSTWPATLLPLALIAACAGGSRGGVIPDPAGAGRPNVVLVMTDDQGVADAGFMGSAVARTPRLDALAERGVVLESFYAAAPVCSPTRLSSLTGLHPHRVGITGANMGHLPADTPNLATLLAERGYRTGHFGKWHLGTLTRDVKDSNRGGRPQHADHYAPPWERGFDTCFSTEAKVPTTDPMVDPVSGDPYGTRYWTGPGQVATEGLEGDDARVIVDRVLPFVDEAVQQQRPFLAIVWFHGPHLPLVSVEGSEAPWRGRADSTYHAVIAGIDAQVGRLWDHLEQHGVADDTLLWFCSDNGPERVPGEGDRLPAADYGEHPYGSAAPLRGRKRSVLEGGVRSPSFVVWPAGLESGQRVLAPGVTTDQVPTLLDLLGAPQLDGLDGVSLAPALRGLPWQRPRPVVFVSGKRRALIDWPWKLVEDGPGGSRLFHLLDDPGEDLDQASSDPERATALTEQLDAACAELRAAARR